MNMIFKVGMSFDQKDVRDRNLTLMKERLMKLVKEIIKADDIDDHIEITEGVDG